MSEVECKEVIGGWILTYGEMMAAVFKKDAPKIYGVDLPFLGQIKNNCHVFSLPRSTFIPSSIKILHHRASSAWFHGKKESGREMDFYKYKTGDGGMRREIRDKIEVKWVWDGAEYIPQPAFKKAADYRLWLNPKTYRYQRCLPALVG